MIIWIKMKPGNYNCEIDCNYTFKIECDLSDTITNIMYCIHLKLSIYNNKSTVNYTIVLFYKEYDGTGTLIRHQQMLHNFTLANYNIKNYSIIEAYLILNRNYTKIA